MKFLKNWIFYFLKKIFALGFPIAEYILFTIRLFAESYNIRVKENATFDNMNNVALSK